MAVHPAGDGAAERADAADGLGAVRMVMRSGVGRTCATWRAAGISGRKERGKAGLRTSVVSATSGTWPRHVRSRCTKTAEDP